MDEILESIINGQRKQALEQMERYDINFKELALAGVDAYDIAILADKKIRG